MKTLVIVTHPNIDASNWNKAWVEELQKHGDITIHELYKSYPDENIDVVREQQLIEAMTGLFFNIRFIGTAHRHYSKSGLIPSCYTAGPMVRMALKQQVKKSVLRSRPMVRKSRIKQPGSIALPSEKYCDL
ncbi:hypothetical protein QFZ77_007103 [Paenibacillus sp. V4I3]|nr:hypothetical protein [Paenibacillus sp. V4I3]